MRRKIQQQIEQIAQETFGYNRLRPGQEEVIQAVLDGHDALAVMPAGAGKSAIYQIAPLQLLLLKNGDNNLSDRVWK
jgi:ATP-dependent DNA helicase RecQ